MTTRKIISITSALLLLAGIYVGGQASAAEESRPKMTSRMGQMMMGEKPAGSCPHAMMSSSQKMSCSCPAMTAHGEGSAMQKNATGNESLLPTIEAHVEFHY